jgi:hypothetical protein
MTLTTSNHAKFTKCVRSRICFCMGVKLGPWTNGRHRLGAVWWRDARVTAGTRKRV